MDVLLTTIIKRPYVFLFLAAFLFLGVRHFGIVKTLIWLATGYVIAFLSEYCSINYGFPYGEYHYIYENLKGELIFAGVPVWDSASYAFMTYAAYSTAVYRSCHPSLRSGPHEVLPACRQARRPRLRMTQKWKIWLTAGVLTLTLDIITDPVAKLGGQWFLGEIYYYAHPGRYFGVPLSNFIGWFVVALAIVGVNIVIDGGLPRYARNDGQPSVLHPIFYISIALFSTVIAYTIGAYTLAITNTVIVAVAAIFIWNKFLPFVRGGQVG